MVPTERTFPTARLGSGKTAHYIDNYRYPAGHPEIPGLRENPRTLCGRDLPTTEKADQTEGLPLCKTCVDRSTKYPTAEEFHSYWSCTDCGEDTWSLGEVHYQVIPSVWEQAYPGYNQDGIGVGSSRPCIGCLENRLERRLTPEDFVAAVNPADTSWMTQCSPRLLGRIIELRGQRGLLDFRSDPRKHQQVQEWVAELRRSQ